MTQHSEIFLFESKIFSTLNKNVFSSLIITLVCMFLVWYVNYHWKRRKLYQMAAQRKGPFPLPLIGNALHFLGSNHDILNTLTRLHNDFESPLPIWLGQELHYGITKPNDMEIIMNKALAKGDTYKFFHSTGILTSPVSKWRKHRKIISPTFNQKILDGFMDIFSEQSEIFVEKLKTKVGKEIFDVHDDVSRCTLDIICETVMDVKVNAQTEESDYMQAVTRFLQTAVKRMFQIFYQPNFIFDRLTVGKEFYKDLKKIHSFSNVIVAEKKKAYQEKEKERQETLYEEEPSKRKTFLELFIELSEKGANLTDEDIRNEVDTLIITGSDTTAASESYVFIIFGLFPDVQDKVYEEVMEVVGLDRPVECQHLGKLQYMERVIKETLRIFPIAPLITRNIDEDIKLESCTLPAGSSVLMNILVLHRDPNVWPEPLKFDPGRFLPEEVAKRHPYSWLPFSGGPRNCIGTKFAIMSMKVFVANAIRKFRFATDYKKVEELNLRAGAVMTPVDGFRVSVELRE